MAVFKDIDDARAYFDADRFAVENGVVQQVSVNYLSGTRGTKLTARAACKKDGRSSCVYNIDVTDDLGRSIAQVVTTGFKR